MRPILSAVFALAMIACGAAVAGEAADFARRQAEGTGTVGEAIDDRSRIAAGARLLGARAAADPNAQEARFGAGLLLFARAVERYGQAQYRHGLRLSRTLSVPLLRLPVPVNPDPEVVTYEAQREAIRRFVDDLAAAEAMLAGMTDAPVKIPIDLAAVRLDFKGTGAPDADGRLSSIVAGLRMVRPDETLATPFEVAFDNADALWLRGYCRLLSALGEFALAHDWHEAFEVSAPLFYPEPSPSPFGGARESAEAGTIDFVGSRSEIADAAAFLHLIRWPVVEPERMKRVRAHLLQVIALSRQTWTAIEAETDDDREWLPGPHQKSGLATVMPIGETQVKAWRAFLDTFEAMLEGRLLMPHWRLAGGFDLKRVFEEPRTFDLILWATGHAAVPYAASGRTLGSSEWTVWQMLFNGNFLGYALWIN